MSGNKIFSHTSDMVKFNTANVIELCRICPPPGTVVEQSLPLTFFDIYWIPLHPMQHLLFYEFPHSKSHFIQSTVPKLKHSLSVALKQFFPLVGNLAFPLNSSTIPEIRYSNSDSVQVTFAECNNDFNRLSGHHVRNATEFHPLVPELPSASMSSDSVLIPLLAIQVTLYPNSGLCIGFAMQHLTADGGSFHDFIRMWASISKLGEDGALSASGELPFHDRTMIKDPNGLRTIYWKHITKEKLEWYAPQILPTNNVRSSFVMRQDDVQKLKGWVLGQCPTLSHISTFAVACAYTWTCWVKAGARTGEEATDEKLENFGVVAECRARLEPPLPKTYFGNCLLLCFATTKHKLLMGEDGFVVAAKLIGEAIREKFYTDVGVLKEAETMLVDLDKVKQSQTLFVAGSPKFLVYETDFGWGRPKKSEIITIDVTGAMTLSESRDDGGVEVGLSLPKATMDDFAAYFADGLKVQKD